MPVLINNNTQLAEDLPQQLADQALQSGSHSIPLNDPEGNPIAVDLHEAPALLQQGHSQPSIEQLQSLLEHAKYSSTPEQIKTFLEGVGKAGTFGLSTGFERGLGIDPKDIRGRAKANPSTEMAGELAGLSASSLIGGEGALLGKAGEAARAATGLGEVGSPLLSRIAGQSVKQATEMAMYQAGDEVSKMLASDPDQTAETALLNVGLGAAMGAGVGVALEGALKPAVTSLRDSHLGKFLGSLKSKAENVEASQTAGELANKAGLDLAPEVKGALANKDLGAQLNESATKAGESYRQSLSDTYSKAADSALEALNRTRDNIGEAPSPFEAGEDMVRKLQDSLKEKVAPLSKQFNYIQTKFSGEALDKATKDTIAERLNKLALDEGYNLSNSSPAMKEIGRITDDLGNLKTLEDLRKYQSVARENAYATQVPGLARKVGRVLRDAEESIVDNKLAQKFPELQGAHQEARQAYRELMDHIDSLNDRLHVGRYHGPDSFITALGEMKPESALQRLTNPKDAGLLDLLARQHPDVAQTVRDYHINSVLSKLPHTNPDKLNINKMLKSIDSWTPELKQFALPIGAEEKLSGIKATLDALPERLNPSGTARTLDHLLSHTSGGIGAIIGGLFGHGPMGAILGYLTRFLGRELPDQGKLAMLKFLGSEGAVNVPAFKAMAKMIEDVQKSHLAVEKAVKGMINGSDLVVPKSFMPTVADRKRLDKRVELAQKDPEMIFHAASHASHYLPQEAQATAQVMSRAVNYLKSLKPNTNPTSPLGDKRIPNSMEEARYQRALSIADKPLSVLQHIHDGTLTPNDVQDLSVMYPKVYSWLKDYMMHDIIEAHDRGINIPFRMRQSLTLFMGMPLDSALMPHSIILNQGVSTPPTPQPQQGPQKAPRGSKSALNKLPGLNSTPEQSREQDRIRK